MYGWLLACSLRHEITRTVGKPSLLENFVRQGGTSYGDGGGGSGSGQEIVFVVVTPGEIGLVD